jgi:hypothetical protein
VTGTATDAAGNRETVRFTVTVNDLEKPQLTLPADLQVAADAGQCTALLSAAARGTASATDNCGGAEVKGARSDGRSLGAAYPLGITTITWTAEDGDGNEATGVQTVTVRDGQPPALTAPASLVVSADPGKCTAIVSDAALENAAASDSCGGVVVTVSGVPAGNLFPLGTTTLTYTATDASGNATTATQTVTVTDSEKPVITCPPSKGVTADAGQCAATVPVDPPVASDNCGAPTVRGSRSDGKPLTDPYPAGATTLTWSAIDAAGNEASCTQTVTVNAAAAPAAQIRTALQAGISQVQQLVSAKVLKPAEGAVLTGILQLAIQITNRRAERLTSADVASLRQFLTSFVRGVNDLVAKKRLPAAQGAALVSVAQSILAALGTPCE